MIPAEAMIGAMLTPISLSIIVPTTAVMTPVPTLFSRLPTVCARCARRVLRCWWPGAAAGPFSARSTTRPMSRWTTHRTTRASTR